MRGRGRRAVWMLAPAVALGLLQCNLDLQPFVASHDAGTYVPPVDAGIAEVAPLAPVEAAAPEAAPPVEAGDPTTMKRVFVTSKQTTGAIGGLDGADKVCKEAAKDLGGMWIAWLSVANTAAPTRLRGAGPWYLVDKKTLAFREKGVGGADGLMVPDVPISLDESGKRVVKGLAWTGTTLGGTPAPQTCTNFTNQGLTLGLAGEVGGDVIAWSEGEKAPCLTQAHLYCFEL